MDVSTVLMIYNEEDNIEPLVRDILAVYDDSGMDGEVICVEDGSEDRSAEVVAKVAKQDPRVVAIYHDGNRGRSWAIRSGFDAARGEVTVIMDSDRQYEPKEIPALVAKVKEGWEVVSGRRDRREDRFDRKLISRVYNIIIVKGYLRTPVKDQNSGLKAFRSDFSKGMGFDPTGFMGLHRFILPLAHLRGGRILEVSCAHYPRPAGKSYIKSTTVPFITLRDLRRFRKVYVKPARKAAKARPKNG
ncbi:MAG: glycosyltransferase family 2 protein [Thermoplasmata archaeon]|nr:glycosyltransferase family 2 protein [Thermoplasmata archaeon]